jgi:hypothetical protein
MLVFFANFPGKKHDPAVRTLEDLNAQVLPLGPVAFS